MAFKVASALLVGWEGVGFGEETKVALPPLISISINLSNSCAVFDGSRHSASAEECYLFRNCQQLCCCCVEPINFSGEMEEQRTPFRIKFLLVISILA